MKEKLVNELLDYFIEESSSYRKMELPSSYQDRRLLLRALINQRPPKELSLSIVQKERALLQKELADKGIVDVNSFTPQLVLWQGDIVTLKCDAIVNAANESMLGCFIPNHHCIDNQIHTYAGIPLRLSCHKLMQGGTLNTSKVILTEAYSLPCKYIIHTVGPIVNGPVTKQAAEQLRGCYINSLDLAREKGLRTIAFPCISTGVFAYPKEEAAIVAYQTVKEYLEKYTEYFDHIVFNVFTKEDGEIYERLFKNEEMVTRS